MHKGTAGTGPRPRPWISTDVNYDLMNPDVFSSRPDSDRHTHRRKVEREPPKYPESREENVSSGSRSTEVSPVNVRVGVTGVEGTPRIVNDWGSHTDSGTD